MNLLVLGLQWGDEGKGKAIDYLAEGFDVVVRYQGGHNAGHTIYYQGQKMVLHLLPSGIFTPGTRNVIGNGVVVNPLQLVNEIKEVEELGLKLENLAISHLAPLILPIHQHLDIIFEQSRYTKIGTTRRGIGPAYEDLAGRRAVLMADLMDKDRFYQRVKILNDYYNKIIRVYGGEEIAVESYVDQYLEAAEALRPFVCNTVEELNRYASEGKSILFEGAQGVLLDINHGTYPFVTSSNPTIGGLFTGTGLSPKALHKIIGISKAYTTRVGEGPFPSELSGDEAEFLRAKGNEYGATTGRPRRVGWLDLVALKYSLTINGIDAVFLTKLDVLDEFDEIKVVTAYRDCDSNQDVQVFDPYCVTLERVQPVTQTLPGWKSDTSAIRDFGDIPQAARDYIAFIEKFTGVPVEIVSVGTERQQTIRK